ncbi:hypothetical protein NFC81_03685 [Salinispirillum sp. LH 10-3-1]|uniref:Uncharacterized protein n=1 Tax=Salinispirillum sp. LH 10-3-1 TaxID=2952525 RepID=A0AB38YHW5_9GAMM
MFHVPQMGRAEHICALQQRVVAVMDGLLLVQVQCRKTRNTVQEVERLRGSLIIIQNDNMDTFLNETRR